MRLGVWLWWVTVPGFAATCSDDAEQTTATTTSSATTANVGQGGSSVQTTGSAQGGSGAQGGAATTSQGGSPSGCQSCDAYLQQCTHYVLTCPREGELCPGSATIFGALKDCLCEPTHCGTNCELTCTGQGNDGNQCASCLDNFAAIICQNDVGACSMDS